MELYRKWKVQYTDWLFSFQLPHYVDKVKYWCKIYNLYSSWDIWSRRNLRIANPPHSFINEVIKTRKVKHFPPGE